MYAILDKYSGKILAEYVCYVEAHQCTFKSFGGLKSGFIDSWKSLWAGATTAKQSSAVAKVADVAIRNEKIHNDAGLIVIDLDHGKPQTVNGLYCCGCGGHH